MKSALVTGGASGLGLALVERLLEDGWALGVLDRRRDIPTSLAAALADQKLVYVCGEASDARAYAEVLDQMVEQFGGLDCLIANAAIWDFSRALLDMTPEELSRGFDELFGVNVKGYLMASRMSAPLLAERSGSIVFTLSNAALYPGGGGPLYTASKHAGVGLVRQLAYELAPQVRVNAVAPTGMSTALSGPSALGQRDVTLGQTWDGEAFSSRVPLGFVPTVADYIEAFLYLADASKSRAVTGIVLPVDMGLGVRGIRNIAGGIRRADSE